MHHDVFFPLGISIRSLDNGRPRTTASEEHEGCPSSDDDDNGPASRAPVTLQSGR